MTSTATLTFDQPTIDAAIAALTEDGAVYELEDGRELRLTVERDEGNPMDEINGCDVWGRVAWVARDRYNDYSDEAPRPAGFDGAAVKLRCYGYALEGKVWWQPTLEVWGLERAKWHADAELRAKETANVKRLLEDGFQYVLIQLYEYVTDSLGHAHRVKVASASLHGIDSLEDGYLAEVVGELLPEMS